MFGVAADDQQARSHAVAPLQFAHGTYDIVDPLARHQAAKLQHNELVLAQPQSGARRATGRSQLSRIEPAGNDRDLAHVRIVQVREILEILRALGDDAIGIPHQRPLDLDARGREPVGIALEHPAHLAQCMEGDDEGNVQNALDVLGHHAGHEEVRVHQCVAVTLSPEEAHDVARELMHVRQHVLLRHEAGRPGIHVYDAHVRPPVDHRACQRLVAAREHVDVVSAP